MWYEAALALVMTWEAAPCKLHTRGVALTRRADSEQRALRAARLVEGAESLTVQLNQAVMFVQHGSVPGFRCEAHEALFRCARIGARNDTETLDHA